MSGQMKGLKNQYEAGFGKNWDAKILPRTREVMAASERSANIIPGTNVSREAVAQEIERRRQARGQ